MSQYIGTRLCRITSIIVSYLLTTIVIETTSGITVVLVLVVEQVVHCYSNGNSPCVGCLEGVGKAQVACEVGIEYVVALL